MTHLDENIKLLKIMKTHEDLVNKNGIPGIKKCKFSQYSAKW